MTFTGIRLFGMVAYLERLQSEVSVSSVEQQQLAAIRMLCDWLVVG